MKTLIEVLVEDVSRHGKAFEPYVAYGSPLERQAWLRLWDAIERLTFHVLSTDQDMLRLVVYLREHGFFLNGTQKTIDTAIEALELLERPTVSVSEGTYY